MLSAAASFSVGSTDVHLIVNLNGFVGKNWLRSITRSRLAVVANEMMLFSGLVIFFSLREHIDKKQLIEHTLRMSQEECPGRMQLIHSALRH